MKIVKRHRSYRAARPSFAHVRPVDVWREAELGVLVAFEAGANGRSVDVYHVFSVDLGTREVRASERVVVELQGSGYLARTR